MAVGKCNYPTWFAALYWISLGGLKEISLLI